MRLPGTQRVLTLTAMFFLIASGVILGSSGFPPASRSASAEAPGNPAFERTWARTDRPVAEGVVQRTWMWGPSANTAVLEEEYAESPNQRRQVQYFDKSRMEINNPAGDESSVWYVTNGLLVTELVTGRMQTGNNQFEQREPAQVNVAGDPDDPDSPTYASFLSVLSAPPLADGAPVTQRLDRAGNVTTDDSLAQYGVTAAYRVQQPDLDHQVASVFWAFMNSRGLVYENGALVEDTLFEDPFYATGYPIAEAYWTTVDLNGSPAEVLVQCFQRRCLTYTPTNVPGWEVEAGNVGQHYYRWRYEIAGESPTATTTTTSTTTATETVTETVTETGSTPTTTSTTPGQSTATATNTPPVAPSSPPDDEYTFGPGLQNVEELIPGTYRSGQPGSDGCFWERRSDPDTAIEKEFSREVQRVLIRPTDEYFWSGGCGSWTLIEPWVDPTPSPSPAPPTATPTTPATGGGTAASCLDPEEQTFLRLLNQHRAANGLRPVTVSKKLNIAAHKHSADMGTNNFFGHTGSDGSTFTERMRREGYTSYSAVAENIAAGQRTGEAVFNAWKGSPGHNANMLDPDLTQIGIGFVQVVGSKYGYYWTTDFANGNDGAPSC